MEVYHGYQNHNSYFFSWAYHNTSSSASYGAYPTVLRAKPSASYCVRARIHSRATSITKRSTYFRNILSNPTTLFTARFLFTITCTANILLRTSNTTYANTSPNANKSTRQKHYAMAGKNRARNPSQFGCIRWEY